MFCDKDLLQDFIFVNQSIWDYSDNLHHFAKANDLGLYLNSFDMQIKQKHFQRIKSSFG